MTKKKKPSQEHWNGMTVAMRTKLASRMHLTVDELEERMLDHELERLDARTTTIWELLGDLDPFDPYIDADELQEAQLYIEEAIYQTEDNAIRQAAIWQYVALAHQFNSHLAPYNTLLQKIEGNPWHRTIDGDMRAFRCYANHYTYDPTKRRKNTLFVGPGTKLVLLIPDESNPDEAAAVWSWRLERYRDDPNYGANCSLFHHKPERTGMKSSELVAAAEDWVKLAWPFIPRMFTYIDPFKIKPYHDRKNREMIFGRCYTLNDWREVGFTRNGLITLAKDFIPLNAQWPWRPKERKRTRPAYWPLEKQIDSLPPWAGGLPEYVANRDAAIVQHAMDLAEQRVTFWGSEPAPVQ